MTEYNKRRAIASLRELEPGDHILARERQPPPPPPAQRGWARRLFSGFSSVSSPRASSRGSSSASTTSCSSGGRHMLVVKVISPEKVHVIYKTEDGVREEAKLFKAEDVTVLEYECKFLGKEAIANARDCIGDEYDPINSNEEHFVTKAKTGTAFEESQVSTASEELEDDYAHYTTRSITSLKELKPGDHIRVPGSASGFNSVSISSSSSSSSVTPERCNNRVYTHHLLVVKVVSDTTVKVIHKVKDDSVLEEVKCYEPSCVTVLEYKCPYTGQAAIERARERKGQRYRLGRSNCEHFVTEVRTGRGRCWQVVGAVGGGVGGGAGRFVVGAGIGVGGGALIGAAAGSFFPIVGTFVGVAVGALIGGAGGGVVGGGAGGAAGGVAGVKVANMQNSIESSQ